MAKDPKWGWQARRFGVRSLLVIGLLCCWYGPAAEATVAPPWQVALVDPHPVAVAPFIRQAQTPSPYPAPHRQQVTRVAFAPASALRTQAALAGLTLQDQATLPAVWTIMPPRGQSPASQLRPSRLLYPGPLNHPSNDNAEAPTFPDPNLVDRWSPLFTTGFEAAISPAPCQSAGQATGWHIAGGQAATGHFAARPGPARHEQGYPPGLQSWLVCGPFELGVDDRLLVSYTYRLAIADPSGDEFFFGVAEDGRHYQGVTTTGLHGEWVKQQVLIDGRRQVRLWLAWVFQSDGDAATGEGLWLDDLQLWRATPPTPCTAPATGAKGIVLTPYDPTAASPAPMIRPGETAVVERLAMAGVQWVRLGFHAQADGLDLQAYDRMVDTLCTRGLRVLGLLNQETLGRQDYNAPGEPNAAAYRAEFAGMAEFLGRYFAGRIGHWEVWNEPNLAEGAYLPPTIYAHLLHRTHQALKRADPNAQVILGGLASAWADSNDYLRAVYAELDVNFQGSRPFDRLALHPYPRKLEGPDPAVYLFSEQHQGYTTILDKFLQTMAEHGDGHKPIWVTELGWNSARQSRNRPTCLNGVLVAEDEQAAYLTRSFDILLNQVTLWQQPETPGVETVFWYQYMDVGAPDPCHPGQPAAHTTPKDWWFGLHRGDKLTPKPGWCAFAAYPQPCTATVALQ